MTSDDWVLSMNSGDAEVVGRKVLLCVCGGIAAYKAAEVLRLLQRAGCVVRVAATQDSLRFVGKATWEGLVHEPVSTSLFEDASSCIPHISLASWADAVLVMPATANVLAKMSVGMADDLVSATLLALPAQKPLIVAPAMNVHMWRAEATQANVRTLRQRGARIVMPVSGRLACDDVGEGKLAPVDVIARSVLESFAHRQSRSLEGRCVLVTAGPTHEAIDPVRYIANSSSGKMGYAIAAEAAKRGAAVTLVSGPVTLEAPADVERISVVSARQMFDAALEAFAKADIAICAAAVADYTPAHPATHKLKKEQERLESIQLKETADILAKLGAHKHDDGKRRLVVGFAAETDDVLQNAASKLRRKTADLIVANDVSREDSGFGTDTNRVTLVSADRVDELPTLSKVEVADQILDCVAELCADEGIA